LVWDVGHQAYGHKILTGRRKRFPTNRKFKGIAGFPSRHESEFDTFGVGHSSTSISAALGMAVASKLKGEKDRRVIAVIGDGALTAGLAYEGLNNAGFSDTNLLIILNDNCMSIDPNVGAMKEYLTDITMSKTWNKTRNEVWNIIGKVGGRRLQSQFSKFEASFKNMVTKSSNLFEAMNLRYFGPVDGHNVERMVAILDDMKNIPGPKLLHILTVKGKGYELAEKDQTKWHAPGLFDKITGEIYKKTSDKPTAPKYQDVFGHTIVELAEKNPKIVGITPAMPSGSSLNIMMKQMPDRAFDVGIAEQHAVTFSAGLATQGMLPFCNIYSTFLQRGYDQVVHDVTIQKLHVIFCLDRGGLVGEDGVTHQGAFDLVYMRILPNMVVSAPMNEEQLRNLMFTAQLEKHDGPFAIRYPRGEGVMPDWRKPFSEIEIGTGRKICDGEEVCILSIGHPGNFAVEACKELRNDEIFPAHYDMRFVKPLDEKILHEVFSKFKKIITVEDGVIKGGFGSAVLEFMADHKYNAEVVRLGMPDKFIEHGSPKEQYHQCGFDADGIAQAVRELIKNRVSVKVD
jgi:1-deoxy-D-xylulose-5-phosphate synthase